MQEAKGRANQLSQQLAVGICVSWAAWAWQEHTGCICGEFCSHLQHLCVLSAHMAACSHSAVPLHPWVRDLLCCGLGLPSVPLQAAPAALRDLSYLAALHSSWGKGFVLLSERQQLIRRQEMRKNKSRRHWGFLRGTECVRGGDQQPQGVEQRAALSPWLSWGGSCQKPSEESRRVLARERLFRLD